MDFMFIYYFNISHLIPNRDLIYLKNFSREGCHITYFQDNSKGILKFFKIFKKYFKAKENSDIAWVGYTAYILVPIVKIFTRQYVVFNASNSLYDGMIISRRTGSTISLTSLKYWLIDFFSFQFSDLILVETNKQKEYISKKFFVNKEKIIRAWTGADDEFFFKDNSIKKSEVFTAVFRGGFLPESGVDCAIQAACILKKENIRFRIIGWGMLEEKIKRIISENNLSNVELLIGRNFTEESLRKMMQSCRVCLGQLSDHPKLLRTIPYKAFESLAMGMPYLTARKEGILELLEENKTCLCFNPGDPQDLARVILDLSKKPELLDNIAKNGYDLYRDHLKSNKIAKDIIQKIIIKHDNKRNN